MTERLAVWLGSERAGDLIRERSAIRFRPLEGGPSLSVAAAAQTSLWGRTFTRAWFGGLLPEGERRDRAEADHGVERGDTFGLLAAIGWGQARSWSHARCILLDR